jgi:hypothetical protein
MWRGHYQPRWQIIHGCLLFWIIDNDNEVSMLPPLGLGDKAAALQYGFALMRDAGMTPRLSRAGLDFVETYIPDGCAQVLEQPAQADYVYLRSDLACLSGNRYHRKKNHLNRFLKTYPDYQYQEINQDNLDAVREFQKKWYRTREDDSGLQWENDAICQALDNFAALDWQGAAIFIDHQVVAYSLGEPLNSDTVVIHIEKGDLQVSGSYVAINQMFCQNRWQGYTYINREQDLGLPGLKAAKTSYLPHHMLRKYLVILP